MVYFDILSKEDAQCFGIQGTIEQGSFLLVAAAAFLALISSFVTKATRQYNYFLERSSLVYDETNENLKVTKGHDEEEYDEREVSSNEDEMERNAQLSTTMIQHNKKLRAMPVMFTDTFRWLLRPTSNK
jgi:hypothetical protein